MTTATKNREELAAKLEGVRRPIGMRFCRLADAARRYRWAKSAYQQATNYLRDAKLLVLLENEITDVSGDRIAKLEGLHSAPDGELLRFEQLVNAKLEGLQDCNWTEMEKRILGASRDMMLKEIRLLHCLPLISKITIEELHQIMRTDDLRTQAVDLLLDHGRDESK